MHAFVSVILSMVCFITRNNSPFLSLEEIFCKGFLEFTLNIFFRLETQTDPNGGKTPRWNRVIHSQLPSGVNTIFVEIYDECSFKMDELIAWAEIKIPESVLRGETHEEWYSLSGKQGDHVEGMIDVVMSFTVGHETVLIAIF